MPLALMLSILSHPWTHQMFQWLHSRLDQLLHWISARLETGSYFALFGVLFCCGLGLPLPEDIWLLLAGALVATGKMKLALAALSAWCGIIGGDVVLYFLGRGFGLEVRRLRLIGRHLTEKRLEQVQKLFARWGVWVVAVGRMFAGIRGAMVVVAGATRFAFWKFLIADGLAAVVSGGLFLWLGYVFGKNMNQLRHRVEEGKRWTLVAALVLAAGFGIWAWLRRRNRQQGTTQPEPALRPDPPKPGSSPARPFAERGHS
ncbi:MAG TPA: DedA family protein [Tepidisphaeraceae bacterium]|nr:DedA family protein [Tepidisphaeraceae bacterium]